MAVLTEVYSCPECDAQFEAFSDEPVYECSRCGQTQVGENRCSECNVFMAKIATASCPDCEAAFEETDPAQMFAAADGSFHATEAEADAWDADAGPREERRLAKAAEHKREMDLYFAQKALEDKAFAEEWHPRMRAVLPAVLERLSAVEGDGLYGLDRDIRSFRDSMEWVGRTLERYDGGRPMVHVGLAVLSVLSGVEGAVRRIERANDYDFEFRRDVEADLITDMNVAVAAIDGGHDVLEAMGSLSVGSTTSLYIDVVIPFLEGVSRKDS